MTISFAEIAEITPDTGSSAQDFITQDPQGGQDFQLQGFAAGSGTIGIWLGGAAFGGNNIEIGSVTVSPTNGVWTFDFPISQIPDGEYTITLTQGTGADTISTPADVLATHSLTVDDQTVSVGINSVEGNNTLNLSEASGGLTVSGTATGSEFQNLVNGQTVQVDVQDTLTHTTLFSEDATIQNGSWDVAFSASEAQSLVANGADGYTIKASVADVAGNIDSASDQFTSTICFMSGTRIGTPDGEANVERLQRGDLILTTDGRALPVSWVGRQTVSTVFSDPLRVFPIRIRAGALDENVPSRDLLLSPEHAILLDGALIQVGALVNGTSILRESNVPQTFTYYHVELDDHSLILAENTPAETFVDNVERLAFDNWAEHQSLYPEGNAIVELPYPRAKSHRQVPAAIRAKIIERACAKSSTINAVA